MLLMYWRNLSKLYYILSIIKFINTIFFRNHKFLSARIQTEYNSFLYRAVSCLYDNSDRTTWQYLVMLPFGQVSPQMVMHIFQYMLHIKSGTYT